jgi:ankyrin repeat protein
MTDSLYNASGDGNLEVVKTLVSCGANVNNSPRIGSALHNASAHGNTDVVEFLIANGADVNAVDEEGQSPLVFATSRGHADVVALLTAHGGRKYVTDAEGLSVSLKVANATLARYEEVGFESLGRLNRYLPAYWP